MNREMVLKLQAYLDGELSRREVRQVAHWVASDPQAQALLNELKLTRGLLAGNEPTVTFPENPDFYWSKIRRALERTTVEPARFGWDMLLSWRRYLAPVAGMALIAFLAVGTLRYTGSEDSFRVAEVENLSEETGSFSFRSQTENLFVVWVYDKSSGLESEPDFYDEEDIVEQ